MTEPTINKEWLFKVNSKEEIRKWVSNLKYCYFWRRPSFRDEGDYFILTLNFTDEEDLLKTLHFFGIKLQEIPLSFPKPIPNKEYSWSEFEKFKNEIKDFPKYEQPSHCEIDNIPIRVWIENKKIDFTFSGSSKAYEVSESDYKNCLHFEKIIAKENLLQKVNRDIESNIGCITKMKYPEL